MSVKLKQLATQRIVITGASSGIGLATARLAAEQGASVLLVSRNEGALSQICDEIKSANGHAEYIVGDVGEREDIQRIIDAAQNYFGGFDTWINNAGVGLFATAEQTSQEDHERLFKTNYWGVVNGSLAALAHFKKNGGGALINVGSILSDIGVTPQGAYSASKHAVKGFTDALRQEVIHDRANISVTLIKPSAIASPFSDHAKNFQKGDARVPPPVYAPELVAKAILHAAVHPTRELTVGGGGRVMVLFSKLLPGTSDKVFAATLPEMSKRKFRLRKRKDSLYKPMEGGQEMSDYQHVHKHSVYTSAQKHPVVAAGIGVLAIAAAAGLVIASHRSPSARAFLKRNVRTVAKTLPFMMPHLSLATVKHTTRSFMNKWAKKTPAPLRKKTIAKEIAHVKHAVKKRIGSL